MSENTNKKSQYRPFTITQASSTVINEFIQNGENTFVSLGFKTGKDKWQNVSLLVDGSLTKLANSILSGDASLDDINPCNVEIHNLDFTANENKNDSSKPYLNTKGILARITKSLF